MVKPERLREQVLKAPYCRAGISSEGMVKNEVTSLGDLVDGAVN